MILSSVSKNCFPAPASRQAYDMKRIFAFILVATTLLAAPVSAFVPDDEELTALLNTYYGPMTSWEAEMTFPDHPGVSVIVWYARGKWRQSWQAGDEAEAVGVGGSVVASCTAGEFALSPLFVWMVPNPLEAWKSWGIDCASRNYGFCGDKPCFMIGAEPGDTVSPTVHLNNEDMSPLFLRYIADGRRIAVVYSEYRTLGGYRVPQKVGVTVDGESLEVAVKWNAVMHADREELYARDSVDTTPCAEPPAPFDFLREAFRYPLSR